MALFVHKSGGAVRCYGGTICPAELTDPFLVAKARKNPEFLEVEPPEPVKKVVKKVARKKVAKKRTKKKVSKK